MTHSFQLDTDKLQTVIDHFNAQSDHAEALAARLEAHLTALRAAGWDSPAAKGILGRIEHDLMPRIVKLREGLGAAGAALADFLERMVGIGPALDQLRDGVPKFEAARDKMQQHIKKLQHQSPDEMKQRLQQILREQGHDDAADQLDQISF